MSIARIRDRQNPAFTTRLLNLVCTNIGARTTDTWDWMVRNRMHIASHGKHMYRRLRDDYTKRGAIPYSGGTVW